MAKNCYNSSCQCSLWQLFEQRRRSSSLAKSGTISFKLRAYCQSRGAELLDHIGNKTSHNFTNMHVSKTSVIFSITVIRITAFRQRLPYAGKM